MADSDPGHSKASATLVCQHNKLLLCWPTLVARALLCLGSKSAIGGKAVRRFA
jgi:hypothetical protein